MKRLLKKLAKMKSFECLRYDIGPVKLTSSDWSAVFFVCKHLKNLKKLDLGDLVDLSEESYLEVLRLLQQ